MTEEQLKNRKIAGKIMSVLAVHQNSYLKKSDLDYHVTFKLYGNRYYGITKRRAENTSTDVGRLLPALIRKGFVKQSGYSYKLTEAGIEALKQYNAVEHLINHLKPSLGIYIDTLLDWFGYESSPTTLDGQRYGTIESEILGSIELYPEEQQTFLKMALELLYQHHFFEKDEDSIIYATNYVDELMKYW